MALYDDFDLDVKSGNEANQENNAKGLSYYCVTARCGSDPDCTVTYGSCPPCER